MHQRSLLVLTRQFHQSVEDELIGGNVRVVRITDAIRKKIAEDNAHQIANWDLYYSGYEHAFVNTYDPSERDDDEAEQEIVRAIVILKIIQPFSSSLHLVLTAEGEPGEMRFMGHSRVGIGTKTYVCASDSDVWITRDHVRKARLMWPNIQIVCQQWKEHRRILRALRFFEIAFSNFDGGIRHILFHSSLETLLCTCKDYNTQQIRQRVLAICSHGVTKEDVRDITDMRAGLVHSGAIVEKAKGREEELIQKLERILRACLYHVLSDSDCVELFSDDEKLKKAFPVLVKEAARVETGKEIYV
jgi:hypothetical protein